VQAVEQFGVHAGDAPRRVANTLAFGIFAHRTEDFADGGFDSGEVHLRHHVFPIRAARGSLATDSRRLRARPGMRLGLMIWARFADAKAERAAMASDRARKSRGARALDYANGSRRCKRESLKFLKKLLTAPCGGVPFASEKGGHAHGQETQSREKENG
jgi:hypothetical protein